MSATTKRKRAGQKATTRDCVGCYNNVYNHGCGGASVCWNLEDAKLVRRLIIHVDQRPPYNLKETELVPSCYKKQRFVTVDPEKSLDDRGFWKR